MVAGLVLIAGAGAVMPSQSDEVVKLDNFYDLDAGTKEDLIAELEHNNPGRPWSSMRIEYTLYNRYLQNHGWCRLEFTTYSIRVTRRLPRVEESGLANNCLREKWRHLIAELKEIEAVKDGAIRSGQWVLSYEIGRLGQYKECSEIDSVLGKVTRGIEERFAAYSDDISENQSAERGLAGIFDDC